ncbi:hypothetical protein F5B22DRAFT_656958 [Xylaria bambusicola]|uniref:uncharacterized protein n=1 Tax=Xylaria bambusicola TaxID=326684 RepID=UPI0020084FED|nr:uncharacterized protein F5B22DRAFT_656958 [Xylaria bambusicola]KAI0513249.1 hypothetical protein F5B22DRAFT_656958 [Xylaria bambusicola]
MAFGGAVLVVRREVLAVSGTGFLFNPEAIIYSFPSERYPDASPADAWLGAPRWPSNTITIARANANQSDVSREGSDFSDQFLLQPSILSDYLRIRRKLEYNM